MDQMAQFRTWLERVNACVGCIMMNAMVQAVAALAIDKIGPRPYHSARKPKSTLCEWSIVLLY